MNTKLHFWISKKDRERLEMIRLRYGGSLSGAVRMMIRATSQKLGIENGNTTEDILNDK